MLLIFQFIFLHTYVLYIRIRGVLSESIIQ